MIGCLGLMEIYEIALSVKRVLIRCRASYMVSLAADSLERAGLSGMRERAAFGDFPPLRLTGRTPDWNARRM
jgi:hypothetical protein